MTGPNRMSLAGRRAGAATGLLIVVVVALLTLGRGSDERRASAVRRLPVPTTTTVWLPHNPVMAGDFPDPDVVHTGSGYFAFATNTTSAHVPVDWSADLHRWTRLGDALPRLPAWAASWGQGVWAPSVSFVGRRYVMAVTLFDVRENRECIGVGTSTVPQGPYRISSDGPVVCQRTLGGSIDPDVFVDGRLVWLLWKSNENSLGRRSRLWSALLSSDLTTVGTPHVLLALAEPWEAKTRPGQLADATIEGPSMFVHDGTDYLVYSGSGWDGANYAMGWAKCVTVAGPCARGAPLPFLQSDATVAGPGGGSVFSDGKGQLWLAYHGWEPGAVGYRAGGARSLRLARLAFVGTTLAVVASGGPLRTVASP